MATFLVRFADRPGPIRGTVTEIESGAVTRFRNLGSLVACLVRGAAAPQSASTPDRSSR